jgi:hypothetical protein
MNEIWLTLAPSHGGVSKQRGSLAAVSDDRKICSLEKKKCGGRSCQNHILFFLNLGKVLIFNGSARLPIPDHRLNQEILDFSMWN